MGKPPKTVTERVTNLEQRIETLEQEMIQLKNLIQHKGGCKCSQAKSEPVEASKVGTVGPKIDDTIPAGDTAAQPLPHIAADSLPMPPDQFLFSYCPQMLQKLASGDQEAAMTVTDWAVSDDTALHFFLLWFAASEDIRKYLLFTAILRHLEINGARVALMRDTISPAGLEEIRETHSRLVSQAAETVKEVNTPQEAEASIAEDTAAA